MTDATVILVPISYPLNSSSLRTLQRATELARSVNGPHLYILHVNLLHKDENVRRDALRREVEEEVGPLDNTSYHIRDAFLLEEAILYEAVQQNADYVIIGKDTRARWRQVLTTRLDMDVDLQAFLQRHLNAELIVV